jgi:TetR/AcrR family fatty acid metabolism transcriptional regulator
MPIAAVTHAWYPGYIMLVPTNKNKTGSGGSICQCENPAPGAVQDSLSGRQRAIISAAIGIIAKNGVTALTTRSLAEALGVTEPALYRHFRDKTDILLAILASFRASQATLHAEVEARFDSPLRKVEFLVGGVFRGFAAQPAMVSVILAEGQFQDDPRLARAVLGIMEDRKDRLTALLAAGRRSGEIRTDADPEMAAMLLMGGMRLLATRWRLSGLAFDLEAKGRELLKAVRRMLAAERTTNRQGGIQ